MGNRNANNNEDRNSAFENIRQANRGMIPPAARPNEVDGEYPFQGYLQMNDGEDATSQVAVLKMHSAIRRESIKLVKEKDEKYYFSFKFDACFEWTITIFICWQELRNANNIPLHFVTTPDLPCPNQYKFSQGLDQDFPPKINSLNTALYKEQDLTESKDDYFPVVLMIETDYPADYKGKAKKSCQITYGKFELESNEYLFTCIKQKFLFNNKMFDLGEIFGIEGGTANLMNDKLCVICFTNKKDTVVLPCRHMCLWMAWSQIVRRQSNNCPICRTKVSTFIQIKDEQAEENNSNNKEIEMKQLKDSFKKPAKANAAIDEDEPEEEEEEDDDDLEEFKNGSSSKKNSRQKL